MKKHEYTKRKWFTVTKNDKYKQYDPAYDFPENCILFALFRVGRKHCVIIFLFQNSYKQNILVCLHINYGYTSILVQIGEPIAIFEMSAIPIKKNVYDLPTRREHIMHMYYYVKLDEVIDKSVNVVFTSVTV